MNLEWVTYTDGTLRLWEFLDNDEAASQRAIVWHGGNRVWFVSFAEHMYTRYLAGGEEFQTEREAKAYAETVVRLEGETLTNA